MIANRASLLRVALHGGHRRRRANCRGASSCSATTRAWPTSRCWWRRFPRHPPKFIAKRSLFRGVPTLSRCLRYGEHAAINRRGPFRPTRRALIRLAQLDRHADPSSPYPPCSLAVFPEGTRSRDGKVARFYRAGTRVLAEHTGLPIVAVALDGGTAISRLGALRNLAGIHYRVRVLAIYPPATGRQAMAAVLDDAHRIIAAQVDAWQASARQGTAA